ncbi:ATP-binding cassette domain-containing protein [Parvimonas sp. G1604]|uniref:ATP-binding cassette domain-containing protein n=1 Tax=Parvimonas sp. G1604 TaxID=3388845 RepID=UPI003D06B758
MKNILENLTFSISDRDKVGVVGDNGSGKTTLFNLLTNELSSDSGEINFAKKCKIINF